MKKLRKRWEEHLDKLDEKWQALPIKKQRLYILLFFILYALLSIGILFKVSRDLKSNTKSVAIEHIENPIGNGNSKKRIQLDTITTIKYNNDERK